MSDMTDSGRFAIEPEAEPIESVDWLRDFADGYIAGWNNADPKAVTEFVTEGTVWRDPSMVELARGRTGVADFVAETVRAFPDVAYSRPFGPLVTDDNRLAVVPWRMTGTHLGTIDPPGFAATGKRIDLLVVDFWQFRSGLIWRSQATWDLQEMLMQLGLLPPRGSIAERTMVRAQRARVKLRF